MALSPGTIVGPYEIRALLGSGGMGEVYRARDTRLGRDIAIKVLPAEYARDPDRLRRFDQEARSAAALNHPNIVTIHSIEHVDDRLLLTMELVEGRSLAAMIPRHGLPVGELLAVAIPLADAVAAAHERGITHRDLKPANVMIAAGASGGRVKVLDFGLAKLTGPTSGEPEGTTIPSGPDTVAGRIVGTAAYMSPEQASGKPIDARSDLFSLGVILYEMATGGKPFNGDSSVAILSSILKDTPRPITEVNPALPSELGRIVRRCLVKEPARRYQTAADLRNELEELKQDLDSGALAPSPSAERLSTRSRWPAFIGVTIAAVTVSAAAVAWVRLNRADDRSSATGELVFTQVTTQPGREHFPSVSPDGKWIVYDGNQKGNSDIYLQSVGGQNAINLTSDSPDDDTQPAFSPDGERIAFRSERQGGGLFVMGRTGESVRRITDKGYSPAWSPDGLRLVFALDGPNVFNRSPSELWVVTLASGESHRFFDDDGVQPSWSPHGFRVAYWAVKAKGRVEGQRDIFTISTDGGVPVPVTSDTAIDWNPVWSPDGRYLYFSSNRGGSMNLWRVAIDERSGAVSGAPEALTSPSAFAGHLSVSADGRHIAYASLGQSASIQKASFDGESGTLGGPAVSVLSGSRFLSHPAPSHDGQWLVCYSIGNQLDVMISRSDGSGERQLTHDAPNDRNPTWSADGQLIAIYSNRSGNNQVWSIRPDGSDLRQLTFDPRGVASFNIWSPDGARLLYEDWGGAAEMYIFDPRKPWQAQTLQRLSRRIDPDTTFSPSAWSPDGTQLIGNGEPAGIYSYSFGSGRFVRVFDRGRSWSWLQDGRRALITDRQRLFVLDTGSREAREILSVAPDDFDSVALSADNRALYFSRATQQGDIWLLTFK